MIACHAHFQIYLPSPIRFAQDPFSPASRKPRAQFIQRYIKTRMGSQRAAIVCSFPSATVLRRHRWKHKSTAMALRLRGPLLGLLPLLLLALWLRSVSEMSQHGSQKCKHRHSFAHPTVLTILPLGRRSSTISTRSRPRVPLVVQPW